MRKSFTKILLLTMAVLFAMPGNAEAAPQRQSALLESSGTGEVVDDHGIIVTPPANGQRKVYNRSGWSFVNNDGVHIVEQSGTVHIVTCDDGTVFIRNILASHPTGAWVKGQRDGNIISVPTRQPIYYNPLAQTTYSVNWGMYDVQWESFSFYGSYSDVINFEVDEQAGTITLQGSSQQVFIGLFWDDDDSFAWHGDWESVWTYAGDFEPMPIVTISAPDGLQTEQWYTRGHKTVMEEPQVVKGTATVGFSGNDVYVKGLFAQFPEAWMKGTIDASASQVVFQGLQLLGYDEQNQPVYAVGTDGGDLLPFVMSWDEQQRVLQSVTGLMANKSQTDIDAVDAYTDITIQLSDPYAPIETLPYTNSLGTLPEWEWFTVVDANDDGKTWHIFENQASYEYHSDNQADDWLISPAFRLQAGKTYRMAIDANCSSNAYIETIEVKMGTALTPEAMTTSVIGVTDLDSEEPVKLENKFITVAETGIYYFGLHAISEADHGSLRAANFMLDETLLDAPAAVTDLTVKASTEGLEAYVSFTAPTLSIGGETLTANMSIGLLRNGELIKTFDDVAPGSTVSYTDNDETLVNGVYAYQVVATNAGGQGDKSPVVKVALSQVFDIPFVADFSQEGTYDLFTTIDANDDGSHWADNSFYAAYEYSSVNDADDYLITPGLRMEAGKRYSITAIAEAAGNYLERFEVLVGREATPEGLGTKVIERAEVTGDEQPAAVDFNGTFVCEESGTYYVAVHCISDADMYALWIHKLIVEIGPELTAPAAAEITATPGDKGALTATIATTAPLKAIDGSSLSGTLKLELYRDGQLIYTDDNVAPGQAWSYTDSEATGGSHTYQIYPYNESGIGQKSNKAAVYVGIDTPQDVTNVVATDLTESVRLNWDAVPEKGANGGYVDPAEVVYRIWQCEPGSTFVFSSEPVATVQGQTTVTLPFATNVGEQDFQGWVVTAGTESGETSIAGEALATLVIGKPYDLPVTESFSDGAFHYYCDYVGVPMVFSLGSDADGAALALTSQQDNTLVAFTTGKLSLKGAKNPTLMVDAAAFGAEDFSIIASTDGQEATVLATDGQLANNYKTIEVSLASLKDAEYVMLGFMARIPTASVFDSWTGELQQEGDAIIIDNIRVIDKYTHNLGIALSAPDAVQAGHTSSLLAVVTNWGEKPAKGYTVTVTAGNKALLKQTIDEELKPFEKKSIDVSLPTTVFDNTGDLVVSATLAYDADENDADNAAEATIDIVAPVAPAPGSIAASDKGDAGVELSWTAPDATTPYTEDFEGGMGGWTTIDADGDGFQWNYSRFGTTPEFMETNGGLASVFSQSYANNVGALTPDNYLVSPRLVLDGTFSFYAKGQDPDWAGEHFAIYVSTTNPADPASFRQVSEEFVATENMQEYSVDLSSFGGQAGYVAIRHFNVSDMFALVVDDITYTMGGEPRAYNLYCDGQLIATVEGSQTAYTVGADKLDDGNRTFAVTAVYDNDQESAPAEATIGITVGIDAVAAGGRPVDVYSLDGKLLRRQTTTFDGLKGIYVVDGKTVMIRR